AVAAAQPARRPRRDHDRARHRRPRPPRRPANDRNRPAGRRGMSDLPTEVDVLVIGAGVAGLSVALGLAGSRRVLVLSKCDGSTPWAQGGIAAAIDPADDPHDHALDTAAAGGGLCTDAELRGLVEEGPLRGGELISLGARFDRTAAGRLSLTLEGGHHRRRVVHAGGDATGAEVARTLTEAVTAARGEGGSQALSGL